MFTEKIEKQYGKSVPISTEEIIALFSNYSSAYDFRMLKKASESGKIRSCCRGYYYIPEKTILGYSVVTAEQIVEKKYIQDNRQVFNIYSGITLLNQFEITAHAQQGGDHYEQGKNKKTFNNDQKQIFHTSKIAMHDYKAELCRLYVIAVIQRHDNRICN